MATIYRILAIIFFAGIFGFAKPSSDTINERAAITNHQLPMSNDPFAKQLIQTAQSQLGVREATGNNDGKQVEQYLNYTGNKKGEPWCASFVSWVFGQVGLKQPRTAWSPALFPKEHLIDAAIPAAVFGIYFTDKERIAHVGIVEKQTENWVYTIEGNTNLAGSREGDGVYRKLRHKKSIRCYADWIAIGKGGAK